MCEKCVRKAKRLGYKPFKYGRIKFFAQQASKPLVSSYIPGLGCLRTPIPLFARRGINCAIEAHIHKINRRKTNKKIYNRKRKFMDR
jgi:hypothetical protein